MTVLSMLSKDYCCRSNLKVICIKAHLNSHTCHDALKGRCPPMNFEDPLTRADMLPPTERISSTEQSLQLPMAVLSSLAVLLAMECIFQHSMLTLRHNMVSNPRFLYFCMCFVFSFSEEFQARTQDRGFVEIPSEVFI